jgi:thiol-disulfide isomerase/thioredoxin
VQNIPVDFPLVLSIKLPTMKKIALLIFLSCIQIAAFAQYGFEKSKDNTNGMLVYKGEFSFDDLKKESEFIWLAAGAKSYKPDTASVAFLKQHLGKFNIVVLMGTWCDDSHLQIPRLYKTLEAVSFPANQCKVYGVDREKQTLGIESKLYQLFKVPTIIVFKGQQEIGRIVETPTKSIEADIVAIIEPIIKQEEKAAKQ